MSRDRIADTGPTAVFRGEATDCQVGRTLRDRPTPPTGDRLVCRRPFRTSVSGASAHGPRLVRHVRTTGPETGVPTRGNRRGRGGSPARRRRPRRRRPTGELPPPCGGSRDSRRWQAQVLPSLRRCRCARGFPMFTLRDSSVFGRSYFRCLAQTTRPSPLTNLLAHLAGPLSGSSVADAQPSRVVPTVQGSLSPGTIIDQFAARLFVLDAPARSIPRRGRCWGPPL